MAAPKSQEKIFMQRVWIKALREQGLTVNFKSRGGAQRARLALYNAVQDAKKGMDDDPELNQAASALEITWGEHDAQLILRMRDQSDMMQGLVDVMDGLTPETVMDKSVEESLRQLDQLTTPQDPRAGAQAHDARAPSEYVEPGRKPNPFYERD